MILNAGATQLEQIVPPASLNGVLEAYVAGFKQTLVVGIAFGGAAFVSAFGFRLMSIRNTRLAEDQ